MILRQERGEAAEGGFQFPFKDMFAVRRGRRLPQHEDTRTEIFKETYRRRGVLRIAADIGKRRIESEFVKTETR